MTPFNSAPSGIELCEINKWSSKVKLCRHAVLVMVQSGVTPVAETMLPSQTIKQRNKQKSNQSINQSIN